MYCACTDPTTVRLLEVIGSGSYGVVHKAVWRGSIVAAKVINAPEPAKAVALREIDAFK